MVFGLFSKLKPAELTAPDVQPQLRTPSPSASVSAGTAPPQSPDPEGSDTKQRLKRRRSESPSHVVEGVQDETTLPPPATPAELLSRIRKIPAKTLHTYVVQHLPQATPEAADPLLAFFATLQPPPKLHCVRCHKDYTEVENTDRSCLIPHDDESAEVMRAGLNTKGSKYETHYGCCNQIVEGEGDLGPPDGWCFEGFHTMDIKRARFRADSTPQDDKLRSCKRNKCFLPSGIDASGVRGRSQRAAARKSLREACSSDEEELDEKEVAREAKDLVEESDAGASASTTAKKSPKKTKPRKRKSEAVKIEHAGAEGGETEKERQESPISLSSIPKSRAKSMKPKLVAKPKSNSMPPPTTAETTSTLVDVEMTSLVNGEPESISTAMAQSTKSMKVRKPRKSVGTDDKRYKPSKDEEDVSSDPMSEDEKPKRKKARRKSTVPAQHSAEDRTN